MNYLAGIILFVVLVLATTVLLDVVTNRNNEYKVALSNTITNMALALVFNFIIFIFIGFDTAGLYILKALFLA